MNRKMLKSVDVEPENNHRIYVSYNHHRQILPPNASKKISSLDLQIAELENFISYLRAEQRLLSLRINRAVNLYGSDKDFE
jgi:hypothetical protein